MALDVSTLASVRAFAAAYRRAYDGLDVLINNAGVMLNVCTSHPAYPACFMSWFGAGCDPTYFLPPTDACSFAFEVKCARIHCPNAPTHTTTPHNRTAP